MPKLTIISVLCTILFICPLSEAGRSKDSLQMLQQAQKERFLGNYAAASKLLQSPLLIKERPIKSRQEQAFIALAEAQYDRAQLLILKLQGLGDHSSTLLVLQGNLALALKDTNKAYRMANKALTVNPNAPGGHLLKGRAARGLMMHREALKSFVHLLESSPFSTYGQQASGLIEQSIADIDSAIKLVRAGQEQLQEQQVKAATALFHQALTIDKQCAEAYYQLGYIKYFDQQDYPTAKNLFTQAITNDPNYTQGYIGMTLVAAKTGQTDLQSLYRDQMNTLELDKKMFQTVKNDLETMVEAQRLTDSKLLTAIQTVIATYSYLPYNLGATSLSRLYNKVAKIKEAEEQIQNGDDAAAASRWQNAINSYAIAARLHPDASLIKAKLALVGEQLKAAVELHKDAETSLLLANLLRLSNLVEDASELYQKILRTYPNYNRKALVHYQLAHCYLSAKNLPLALQSFQSALQDKDMLQANLKLIDALWRAGETALKLKQPKLAEKLLQYAHQKTPRSGYVRLDLGRSYADQGRHVEALKEFRAVYQAGSGAQREAKKLIDSSLSQLSYTSNQIRSYNSDLLASRIKQIQKRKQAAPNSPVIALKLGEAYLANKQYLEALNEFNVLLDRFPENLKAEQNLVTVYRHLGYTQAQIMEKRFSNRKRVLAGKIYHSAERLFEQKRYDLALTKAKAVLVYRPKHHMVYYLMGNCYYQTDRPEEAMEAYRISISIRNNWEPPYSGLALLFNAKMDFNKAIEYAQKAVSLNPKSLDAHNYLGYSYFMLKDYPQARKHFDAAIKISPNSEYALENISRLDSIEQSK